MNIIETFKTLPFREQEDIVYQINKLFNKEVIERDYHRSQEWCDRLIACASEVVGKQYDSESREVEDCLIRDFVALELSNEGMHLIPIGERLGRSHTTICNSLKQIRKMFDVPQAYRPEIEMWNQFQSYIQNEING